MKSGLKRSLRHLYLLCILIFTLFAVISCSSSSSSGGDGIDESDYPLSYPNAKIIFVTHTIDSGDLSSWFQECESESTGLEAADCICQLHAERWGDLSGTYKAWLSDSTTSASSRLTHSNQPYVNRIGEQIAANWDELTAGTLPCDDIMNYDEGGDYMSTQFNLVWTGTDRFGNAMDPINICNDWTNEDAWNSGYVGSATVDEYWPNFGGCWTEWVDGNGRRACDLWNRLYCVEQ